MSAILIEGGRTRMEDYHVTAISAWPAWISANRRHPASTSMTSSSSQPFKMERISTATSTAPPKFSYQPLDHPDSIRLIHLLPASSPNAELKCSLIHTTLKACADIYDHYTALSYVWGDSKDTRTILLDGLPVKITVNLFSALRDL